MTEQTSTEDGRDFSEAGYYPTREEWEEAYRNRSHEPAPGFGRFETEETVLWNRWSPQHPANLRP